MFLQGKAAGRGDSVSWQKQHQPNTANNLYCQQQKGSTYCLRSLYCLSSNPTPPFADNHLLSVQQLLQWLAIERPHHVIRLPVEAIRDVRVLCSLARRQPQQLLVVCRLDQRLTT
jgi:hypothetical protein